MRYRAKTDVRQPEIVAALRKFGATVCITSGLGKGFPDFIAGYQGGNYLFELKSPTKTSHRPKGKLTPDQVDWHSLWRGQLAVIETAEEAFAVLKGDLPPGRTLQPEPVEDDQPFAYDTSRDA